MTRTPAYKRLVVTHIDLDGVGIPVLLEYFKDIFEFDKIMTLNYDVLNNNDVIEELKHFNQIYFTDFAPSPDIYDELIKLGIDIFVYDHHESSEWIKKYPNVWHDMTRCGTKIFFEEYILPQLKTKPKDIIYHFVELVDVYDCWRLEHPLREEACDLHHVLFGSVNRSCDDDDIEKFRKFINNQTQKLQRKDEWLWVPTEIEIIKRAHMIMKREYAKLISNLQERVDRNGKKFLVSFTGSKISLNASRLLQERPDVDYLILINAYRKLNKKMSGRTTREDINLQEYFQCLKGHKKAAGGEFNNMDDVHAFLNGDIYDLLDYTSINIAKQKENKN